MVRTSRNGAPPASMDALDNIDLDDMFADDGDALFDGLDIDLDMDDITGSSVMSTAGSGTNHQRPLTGPATSRPPPPAASEEESVGSSRTRRKTKRKAKTPAFFEDTDDDAYTDPPVKKRKTKATAAAAAAATKKKKTVADKSPPPTGPLAATTSTTLKKSKLTVTSMMPPPQQPLARGQSTPGSYVAAAGQFGGRQKRGGSSFALPKAASNSNTNSAVGALHKNKLPFARASSDTTGLHKSSHRATTPGHASVADVSSPMSHPTLPSRPATAGGGPPSTFCGLGPSHTQFYPFMPTLPQDLALKSRKVYPAIDRIHALFASHVQAPNVPMGGHAGGGAAVQSNEPVFYLLQEAFKDEKTMASLAASTTPATTNLSHHRSEMVGQAIGGIRRTIGMFDQSKIIADWFAVCSLLQRQHDFLKQNNDNMERWCRDNLSDEDYASVYLPSFKRRVGPDGKLYISILGDFTTRDLKVVVQCHGFKAPRADPVLRATLPDSYMLDTSSTDAATAASAAAAAAAAVAAAVAAPASTKAASGAPKSKKKKTPASSAMVDTVRTGGMDPFSSSTHTASSKVKQQAAQQPLSYANMKPARRRKNVAEMLTRTARDLENANLSKLDARRRLMDQGDNDLQKLVDQDAVGGIHTACMWKWLEVAGFYRNATKAEMLELRDEVQPQTAENSNDQWQQQNHSTIAVGALMGTSDGAVMNESIFDKLQSLLVEEDAGESSISDDDELHTDMEVDEVRYVDATADLSQLSLDERTYIHLKCWGLGEDLTIPRPTQDSAANDDLGRTKVDTTMPNRQVQDTTPFQNGHKENVAIVAVEGTLDDAISSMIMELASVDSINVRRIDFLDTVAKATQSSDADQKRKHEQESALIAKCQQIMRKSKELKAKSNATIKKDDSLALPW